MTKLAFFSDLHYYSPSLGVTGRAYELREGSDQKCLKETGAILDGLCAALAASDCDAVVIPGDVTNDGERESHEEAIAVLDALNEKKPVFAITSTHDWCSNEHACRYEGETVIPHSNVVSKEELPSLYEHFGKDAEVSRFVTAIGQISRSFAIGDVLLLAVNDDCDAPGGRSGYSEEHLAWMKSQIDLAKERGLRPIAIEHHLLLHNVSPLVNKGQSIGDNFATAARLADMGLRLILTGHSHIQRTSSFTSEAGNTITQINLGSISGYPGLITYVTVDGGRATITEEPFEFVYEGRTLGTEYLKEHSTGILTRIIGSGANDREDFFDILSSNGIGVSKLRRFYPVIRRLCRTAETITVGKAAKKLNRLFVKPAVNADDVATVKDDLLMDHIKETFLDLFWWGNAENQTEEVKRIVADVGKLPGRAIKTFVPKKKRGSLMKTAAQIEELVKNLVYPEKNPAYVDLD